MSRPAVACFFVRASTDAARFNPHVEEQPMYNIFFEIKSKISDGIASLDRLICAEEFQAYGILSGEARSAYPASNAGVGLSARYRDH
jgi:hypothetical protein